MSPATLLPLTLAAALVLMTGVWLVSLWRRDVSIVDPFWGPGFVLVATVGYFLAGGAAGRRLLLLVLTAIWGLRLGGYLLARNLRSGEEDYRYQKIRAKYGARFPWLSLVIIFWFQAVLLWFISLPVQIGQLAATPASLTWLDGLGAAVWALGLFFEAVGDRQLARFKADPTNRGKVLDTGLWRYTRHPNYFGDFLVWWGLFLIALATPQGWMTVLSPVVMSLFLIKVSGAGLLEKDIVHRRPQYADYIARTSGFLPWPPRRS